MLQRVAIPQSTEWDNLILRLPSPHLLQSAAWGEFKARHGWSLERVAWLEAGEPRAAAQLLTRSVRIPGVGWKVALTYCPKGPLLDWSHEELWLEVLADLSTTAGRRGAMFLKIDPDVPLREHEPARGLRSQEAEGDRLQEDLKALGWLESGEQVQFRNTLILDLRPEEDELLARMKQKTRYNIRLAGRRGVEVRLGTPTDLDLLYRLFAETSIRDGFVIRSEAYYRDAWGSFLEAGLAQPFVASVDGAPVAALIVYRFGQTAWYLYGMSTGAHREKMPNHLLQWEAIRWAKEFGCIRYDFWGAPGRFDESDPMWGVYRFKEGFGGQVVRTIGAWDYPIRPGLYWVYARAMPWALEWMRRSGMRRVREGQRRIEYE